MSAHIDQLIYFLSRARNATLFALAVILFSALPARSGPVPGSLPAQWNIGAEDCAASPQPPLQVYAYEPQTLILRQNPCANPEANFLYLLIGSEKALLIDTGAVADAEKMPLARTVLVLLPLKDGARLPLLVVHTHQHHDHYAGDTQFASLPAVQVIAPDLASVRAFFGFDHWPEGVAHLNLGDRVVDIVPGDFVLAGRLTIEDTAAEKSSAARVIAFLANRPVAHTLGGHIERDTAGHTYAGGATYHPNERALELSRQDLVKLPSALASFNGFYASHENYSITHPMHSLLALLFAAFVLLSVVAFVIYRLLRWRRRRS